ncbi:MAG TPA: hypothetical protein QF517_04020 [Pseudomonadales bacterium]|nr:hypothetical protein [Pseudomonadales bacterium]MDP6315682.1 hypothetical protein [Pseudomonadales bacterium]MDP7313595.1 hypothetical protein [Pseudomonadales bacterium]MDP7576259.1 hypothetical protein [Pseudomonadales bacterium]HJL61100.1 hypothetical protein [Pseudomonadales bacterium]
MIEHDESGSVSRLRQGIVAGFVRKGIFYALEQAPWFAKMGR